MTKVCLRCGSSELATPSLSRGGVPGAFEVSGLYRCTKCGFVGVPIEVEDAKKFREHLSKPKPRGKKKGSKPRKRGKR